LDDWWTHWNFIVLDMIMYEIVFMKGLYRLLKLLFICKTW